MKNTPLILLPGKMTTGASGVRTESYSTGRFYSQAIARAGGVVLQIQPIEFSVESAAEIVARFDGVIIQGGGDVDPAHYGQKTSSDKVYGTTRLHDELDLAVVRAAIQLNKPMLAICRGIQVLNVALGGTLIQDLGEVLDDGQSHWNTYHEIALGPDSKVARAMKTTAPKQSHSYHHQALDRVADGLIVTGRAPDNTIEAVEHKTADWVVGVQWHPEDTAETTADQQNLFNGFVDSIRQS